MENNSIQKNRSGILIFTIICNLALLLFAIYLWLAVKTISKQEFLIFSGLTLLPILNIYILSKYVSINLKKLVGVIVFFLKRVGKTIDTIITTHINANISSRGIFVSLGIYTVIYLTYWNLANSTLVIDSPALRSSSASAVQVVFTFLLLIACGFIAGRRAKASGWLNGIIVGLAVPIINFMVYEIIPEKMELIYIPPTTIFLHQLGPAILFCFIGGLISDFMRRKRKKLE